MIYISVLTSSQHCGYLLRLPASGRTDHAACLTLRDNIQCDRVQEVQTASFDLGLHTDLTLK